MLRLFLYLCNIPEEATQVETREKEAAKVTNDENSTGWRKSFMISNEMIRLFLYLFNIPKACYLVEGAIISHTLVEYGVLTLLMSYLTTVLGYSLWRAAVTLAIFAFVSGILSIFADLCRLWVGCYFMVQVNSISYILALVVLLENYRYSASMEDMVIPMKALYVALFLLAVGRGVSLSTCTKEFLGDQMMKARRVSNDEYHEKRDDIRYEISTMRAKIVAFAQIKTIFLPHLGTSAEDRPENHPKAGNTKTELSSSNQQSGIVGSTSLGSAAPICLAFLVYGVVCTTGDTFLQNQEQSSNTSSLGGDRVSLMMLQIIARTSRFLINPLLNRVLFGRSRTRTHATLFGMGLGMFFSIVTCAIARWTEVVRLTAIKHNHTVELSSGRIVPDIDVALFIPQFITLGFVTGLAGDGLEAFFENEYSNWIKIFAPTITEVLTGMGSLLYIVLLLILKSETTWFVETQEESPRVDLYYQTIAVMCVLNFIPLYALASTCYYRRIKIWKFLLDGMGCNNWNQNEEQQTQQIELVRSRENNVSMVRGGTRLSQVPGRGHDQVISSNSVYECGSSSSCNANK
ncbi:hypothetical protein MKW94_011419 [Papaver nudicaule]|uniref:Uncharacterized protein n=1 Tax=Papaver nudicaule TaxID=74823 RepID=A0AA41RR11_PAPNU|nr:hypothetical protein [Papaver nudicaule]